MPRWPRKTQEQEDTGASTEGKASAPEPAADTTLSQDDREAAVAEFVRSEQERFERSIEKRKEALLNGNAKAQAEIVVRKLAIRKLRDEITAKRSTIKKLKAEIKELRTSESSASKAA